MDSTINDNTWYWKSSNYSTVKTYTPVTEWIELHIAIQPERTFFKTLVKKHIKELKQKQTLLNFEKQNKEAVRKAIEQIAYYKWIDAGKPDGRHDEFWKQAEEQYYYQEVE